MEARNYREDSIYYYSYFYLMPSSSVCAVLGMGLSIAEAHHSFPSSPQRGVAVMLQNPARTPTQYAQSFGTPGNVNIAMNGAQGVPFGSQPQTQRGRPRATSNINMQAPEGYQSRDPNISQWQSGVLASQAGSAQPPQGERSELSIAVQS